MSRNEQRAPAIDVRPHGEQLVVKDLGMDLADGRHLLTDADMTVEPGQRVMLSGRSGSGKSTLLRLINRLETPSGGQIIVDNEDVTAMDANGLRRFRQQVGMIFQHFNLLASKTVADNVAMPLTLAGELSRSAIDKRVAELLERV
ncbi:ATP-binding cassette domain-containing protein, partial [Salmonella enterica subsp. enterica]